MVSRWAGYSITVYFRIFCMFLWRSWFSPLLETGFWIRWTPDLTHYGNSYLKWQKQRNMGFTFIFNLLLFYTNVTLRSFECVWDQVGECVGLGASKILSAISDSLLRRSKIASALTKFTKASFIIILLLRQLVLQKLHSASCKEIRSLLLIDCNN